MKQINWPQINRNEQKSYNLNMGSVPAYQQDILHPFFSF